MEFVPKPPLTRTVIEGPYKNLMWFPETYRRIDEDRMNESFLQEVKSDWGFAKERIRDKKAWRDGVDYFLHRRLETPWWSSEFFTYVKEQ